MLGSACRNVRCVPVRRSSAWIGLGHRCSLSSGPPRPPPSRTALAGQAPILLDVRADWRGERGFIGRAANTARRVPGPARGPGMDPVCGRIRHRLHPQPTALRGGGRRPAAARDACYWLEDVADAPSYPTLTGTPTPTWSSSAVGTADCGPWCSRSSATPAPGGARSRRAVGSAASGPNGGFCAASITHGEENGRSALARRVRRARADGRENLAGIERAVADLGLDCEFERTGELDVATEPHQVEGLRAGCRRFSSTWTRSGPR